MTHDRKKPGGITAAELIAQLAQDRKFQQAAARREVKLQARSSEFRQAEQPIVEDLRRAGVQVQSVWDLVNTSEPYSLALPILMKHLERGGYPDRVLEGLSRALAVEPASVYWERLRDLYLSASGPDEEEGLAVALAASATREHIDALLALLSEDSRGDSRIHFLRAILRVGGNRGREVVEKLRSDPLFGKEASSLIRGEIRGDQSP
jgi:hypothetical protein